MINLRECKFGDRLKMRNGKMAIYVGKQQYCFSHYCFSHYIVAEQEDGYMMLYADDNGVLSNSSIRDYDIISKYEDPVQT